MHETDTQKETCRADLLLAPDCCCYNMWDVLLEKDLNLLCSLVWLKVDPSVFIVKG